MTDEEREIKRVVALICDADARELKCLAREILAPHLAKIKELKEENAALSKRLDEPVWIYDPDDWEWTNRYSARSDYEGTLCAGEIKKYSTLIDGPPRILACVVVTRDENGDPDETEERWFNNEDDARAAIEAALVEDDAYE